MQPGQRPTGVTILAVLEFIVGIIALLGGLGALVGSAALGFAGRGMLSGVFGIFGGVALIFGILALVVGWGMWTGREWAWIVGIVLAVLGLVSGVVQLAFFNASAILQILIDLLILYYLTRPHVKAFFKGGKQQMPSSTPPSPPPTST